MAPKEFCSEPELLSKSNESVIWKGTFGTVYKSYLNSQSVAIKIFEVLSRLNYKKYKQQLGNISEKEINKFVENLYFREMFALKDKNHENIIKLIDFTKSRIYSLVYEYMPNGSLHSKLHNQSETSLSWKQLSEIAFGVARGLEYLHNYNTKPFIHGDLESKNILLDKHFVPKISGFGVQLNEELNQTENDVYSYGRLLYEMATCSDVKYKNDISLRQLKYHLARYIGNEHKTLNSSQDSEGIFFHFIALARKCCDMIPFFRPQMHEIIQELYERTSNGAIFQIVGYNEIEDASRNWNYHLGEGSFGTVYKGKWNNKTVAIKTFVVDRTVESKKFLQQQRETFFTEISVLCTLSHQNIIQLFAYNIDNLPCLVYEYMAGGTLFDKLHNNYKRPLSWIQRLNISLGIAQGLEYLHNTNDRPLIHCDLKSDNIFLDRKLNPKIGDFGLVKEGIRGEMIKVTDNSGCCDLLPPEYLNNYLLSDKVDIYSYGIILYEIATGLPAYDERRECELLKDYVEQEEYISYNARLSLMDYRFKYCTYEEEDMFFKLLNLGADCCHDLPEIRPSITTVLNDFQEKILEKNIGLISTFV